MTNKSNKPVVEVHETPFAPSIKSSSTAVVTTPTTTPSKTSAIPQVTFPQVTFPQIHTFTDSAHPEFGSLRTVTIDGEPWFVGKDVAIALGYSKPTDAVRKRVLEEDRGISKMETPSGTQQMTIINESGLYSLIHSHVIVFALSLPIPSQNRFYALQCISSPPFIIKPLTGQNTRSFVKFQLQE